MQLSKEHKEKLDQLIGIMLIALAFCFPFQLKPSAVLIIAVTVFWLVGHYREILPALKNKYVIMLMMMAIVPLLTMVYSEERDMSHFEKRISFVIFPLIFYTTPLNQNTIRRILYSFSTSCVIASVYTFLYTVRVNYKMNGLTSIVTDLYGPEMTIDTVGTSHVYLGMYIAFAIAAMVYLIITRPFKSLATFFLIASIGFEMFFLFILGGKMAIIALMVLAFIACIVFTIRTRRLVMGLSFIGIPVLAFVLTIQNFEYARYRFTYMLNPDNYFVGDNAWNSIGVRFSILKCTFETIKQSPILGSGLGDQQAALNKCYETSGFTTLTDMNTHNQYLQFLLGTGMAGLAYFLYLLVFCAIRGVREKKELYFGFLFIFALCCLTESILERQHGVMFFAFFNAMFFFGFNSDKPSGIDAADAGSTVN